MKRILLLVLATLLLVSTPPPAAAHRQSFQEPRQAGPASPQAAGWIALVAGDVVDLKWDPAQYPSHSGETFLRWEIYRGLAQASMARIAQGTSKTTDFYRDERLVLDSSYYYEIKVVFCKAPCQAVSDEVSYSVYRSSATETGWFRGKVHRNLVLSEGVFKKGDVEVADGAVLSIGAGTRLTGGGYIKVIESFLRIDGADFEGWPMIEYGKSADADSWGHGWVRNTTFEPGGSVSIYGQSQVPVSYNTGPRVYMSSNVPNQVRGNKGESLTIGGSGAHSVEHNTVESISVWSTGAPVIANNTAGKLLVADGSAQIHDNTFGDVTVRDGTPTISNNSLGTITVEAGSPAFDDNLVVRPEGADFSVRVQDGSATFTKNVFIDSFVNVSPDWGEYTHPGPTLTGNKFYRTSKYRSSGVGVYAGANATLVDNQIDGMIDVSQTGTSITARGNTVKGGIKVCYNPVINLTENIVERIQIGSFILECSGDATGIVERNTVQGDDGLRIWDAHDGLSIRHNCIRNSNPGAWVAEYLEHTVNLRENYWGHETGPNHPSNPGGAGTRIEGGPVDFSPWDTTPANCRDVPADVPLITEVELDIPSEVPPDGTTIVSLNAQARDQDGDPFPDASVGFGLDPQLGKLADDSDKTGDDGWASVEYTAPSIYELGSHDEIEVKAIGGLGQDTATLRFIKPDVEHTAEPRYHQSGWPEWHALLPPDDAMEARLWAKLTLNGKPVTNYTVTLEIDPLDGFFDGQFFEASNVLEPVEDNLKPRLVKLLTDGAGELWVKYRPMGQSSRDSAVKDGVRLSSDAFDHLASWLVESGMDLELVALDRPGASSGDWVVMGKPEPMEIEVRDRLHPAFSLASYNDDPDPIVDPDADSLLGVRLDVGDPARDVEYLDLLNIDNLGRVPQDPIKCYFELAPNGRNYLRTSDPARNVSGRPAIIPRLKNRNLYWIGIHFLRRDGLQIRDTYPIGQQDNNYALAVFTANEQLDTWDIFLRDNPCSAGNTHWGRKFKCALGILTWYPGIGQVANLGSTILAACELFFDVFNGNASNAAVNAGNFTSAQLSDWLGEHPDLPQAANLTRRLAQTLNMVGNVAKVMDCYWAVKKAPGRVLSCCGPMGITQAEGQQADREIELWVQGLLQAEESDVDALVIMGTDQSQVTDSLAGIPVETESGAMAHTQETYFSLVNEWGSFYLLPPSSYALTFQTSADTEVILFRKGSSIEDWEVLRWEDPGTIQRQASLSFDRTSASAMQVDEGANGSVDRTVAPTTGSYLANPTNLLATESGIDKVRLEWDWVEGASGYRVHYGRESRWMPLFEGYEHEIDVHNTSSYLVEGLDLEGWVYYFSVTAEDSKQNLSLYSAEAVAGTPARPVQVCLPVVMRSSR